MESCRSDELMDGQLEKQHSYTPRWILWPGWCSGNSVGDCIHMYPLKSQVYSYYGRTDQHTLLFHDTLRPHKSVVTHSKLCTNSLTCASVMPFRPSSSLSKCPV